LFEDACPKQRPIYKYRNNSYENTAYRWLTTCLACKNRHKSRCKWVD